MSGGIHMNRQVAPKDHDFDNEDFHVTKIFDRTDFRDGKDTEQANFERDDAKMKIYIKNYRVNGSSR
jgi:hypothetical protein